MGIVIRQSFWTSFITYFGAGLGYLSTLILFPKFLSLENIGLVRLVQSNALMLVPVVALGMPNTLVKYFPDLENLKVKSTFFSFQIIVILLANFIVVGILLLSSDVINLLFEEKSERYISYLYATLIILISQSLFEHFSGYFRVHLDTITPNFLKEVVLRLFQILLLILHGLGWISLDEFISFLSLSYIIVLMAIIMVANVRHPLPILITFRDTARIWGKKVSAFGAYVMTIGIGNSVVANYGFILTSTHLGLEKNGIYTICVFIATVIEMPKRAASQIIGPLYSQSIKEGDRNQLQVLYKRSSINLFIVGVYIAIGIVTNVLDLFKVMPQGERMFIGFGVVSIISITKVISMLFGTASELIFYSKLRRYNTYILILNAAIIVVFTPILIKFFGITGPALAILFAVVTGTLLRNYIIKRELKMRIFNTNHFKVLLVASATSVIGYLVSIDDLPILSIIVRSVAITVFFGLSIYFTKVSYEINDIIHQALERIGIRLK